MKSTSAKPLILFFPFDLLSHYLRCLQLAYAVRDLFEVRFAYSERYAPWVQKAGFKTFACEQFDTDIVMACARRFDFSWLNKGDITRVLRSQAACLEYLRPVAVLGDTAPTLKMAAQLTGTRHMALMNGYMSKHYAFTRSLAAAHPAARFQKKLPCVVFDKMIRFGEYAAFRHVHQPFRALRRKYGLPKITTYLDELEGDENLICDLPELFPQKPLPGNYHLIGPLFHQDPDQEAEISRFLENSKKALLLSVGSSGMHESFAFLNDPAFQEYKVIVAGEAGHIFYGENIYCKQFINVATILSRIDLVICHGGNGTNYQALSAGVPVLCQPELFEQEWNVQRIVELEVGADLRGLRSPEEIAAVVEHWLGQKQSPQFARIRKKIDLMATRQRFRQLCRRDIVLID